MSGRPRVLFVSHQATRTGAPRVLISFVRWVVDHGEVDAEVLLLRDGPLEPEFRAIAPVHVAGRLDRGGRLELLERNLPVVGLEAVGRRLRSLRLRPRLRRLDGFDLVWLNCVESARVLPDLPAPSGPVVSHVHELEMAIRFALPEAGERRAWLDRTDHFVAVSDHVAANLVASHGVDPAAVSRHYEFVDRREVVVEPRTDADEIRRRLGIPADAPVVGAAGTQEWRKGTDLFLQLPAALDRRGQQDAHLIWLGGGPAQLEIERFLHDRDEAGHSGRVHFVGEQDRASDWYRVFDVLVLTSREDPFPLVCLEAGLLETPVVAFDCGGMSELLDGDNGEVVPALDVEAMADRVAALLADPERRARSGRRLRADVEERHLVETAAPALYEQLMTQWRK